MLRARTCASLIVLSCSFVGARAALAQPTLSDTGEESAKRPFEPLHPFVELSGNWGLQLGEQSYMPAGAPGASKAPMTNGYGGAVTAGYSLSDDVQVLLDVAYGQASSRTGEVTGAMTSVDASIAYDTIVGGARLARTLGPGRVYGELGVGAILPFNTRVSYAYASTLQPLGISGTGYEVANYKTGFGGLAEFGYHMPIMSGVYVGASLRLQAFQTSNDGEATSLNNFVTDFSNPHPVTGDIHHGTTAAATPENYSVQDARLHVAIGYDF